jgi:hypothetical protein
VTDTQVQTVVQEWRTREFAGPFDLRVSGPAEQAGHDYSRNAIGGAYGIAWWEYYKDAMTCEVYRVRCHDGVNSSRSAYSLNDDKMRHAYFSGLFVRFRQAESEGATQIVISRNERAVMQGFTCAWLLESAEGRHDGEEPKEGLEGGFVGRFHGIPVICDPGSTIATTGVQ